MQQNAQVQTVSSENNAANLLLVSNQSDVHVDGMSLEEIYSLFEPDPSLPLQITSMFANLEFQYRGLKRCLKSGDRAELKALSSGFRSSVSKYLKLVSKKMYVPVRKRLKICDATMLPAFVEFETKTLETNNKVARLMRRRDGAEAATGNHSDIELTGIMHLLSSQLKAERTYLFPLYSDSDELAA